MNYENLPNNVYYDANIINNSQASLKQPPKLIFSDIRSTSILENPSMYELSIIRFNLMSAGSLPIWVPSINVDQKAEEHDPNLTNYSFTLDYTYNGEVYSSSQTFVLYIHQVIYLHQFQHHRKQKNCMYPTIL